MVDLLLVIQQCAPAIDPRLAASLVRQESAFNPYAIGLDGKAVLKEQPRSLPEAVKKAEELQRNNQGFSVGLAQLHVSNVRRFGLTWTQAFEACTNLQYGQIVLQGFHDTALKAGFKGGDAVHAALRGYNSGDISKTVSNGYANAILQRVHQQPLKANEFLPKVPAGLQQVDAPTTGPAAEAAVVAPMGAPKREEGESQELFEK